MLRPSDRAPGLVIDDDVVLPHDVEIGAGAVIHHGVEIGAGVRIQDGAILGKALVLSRTSQAAQREPEATVIGVDVNPVIGISGFLRAYDALLSAFPDMQFEIQEILEQGDMVAVRWLVRTHQGSWLGRAATGRRIEIPGMSFGRVKNGKFIEAWDAWDRSGLDGQIGSDEPSGREG